MIRIILVSAVLAYIPIVGPAFAQHGGMGGHPGGGGGGGGWHGGGMGGHPGGMGGGMHGGGGWHGGDGWHGGHDWRGGRPGWHGYSNGACGPWNNWCQW